MRMYLSDFEQDMILRFGTLDLIRGDYRRYQVALDENAQDPYTGIHYLKILLLVLKRMKIDLLFLMFYHQVFIREQLNNNNNIIRQNEQSLSLRTCWIRSRRWKSLCTKISMLT